MGQIGADWRGVIQSFRFQVSDPTSNVQGPKLGAAETGVHGRDYCFCTAKFGARITYTLAGKIGGVGEAYDRRKAVRQISLSCTWEIQQSLICNFSPPLVFKSECRNPNDERVTKERMTKTADSRWGDGGEAPTTACRARSSLPGEAIVSRWRD